MIDDKNFGNRLTECMKIAGYTNSKLTEELNFHFHFFLLIDTP